MATDVDSTAILFLNASIVDGSGDARYIGSVYVRDDTIDSIHCGQLSLADLSNLFYLDDARIMDCDSGHWTLSPGFIDMHAHSDLALLHTPDHAAKITQGVTTEVIGQDGIGYAPVDDASLPRIRLQIAAWNGNPSTPGFFDRWRSVRDYLDVLDRERIATNVAYLVPQGNLRILVKGWDPSPATESELAEMERLLRVALADGAVGMSSGLTYVPGMFASTDELARLCAVVREYDGYYCPHTRSYGRDAVSAYAEMLTVARTSGGVRLHLTHATLNFDENASRADDFLSLLAAARSESPPLAVTLDSYPYLPGATSLAALLPSWVAASPDPASLLRDPSSLAEIRHACLVSGSDGCHGVPLPFSLLEISAVGNPLLAERFVGKPLTQIAAESSPPCEPFAAFVSVLLEDNFLSTVLMHVGHEHNVRAIMRDRAHCLSSDALLVGDRPHPRAWGTFPRFVKRYTSSTTTTTTNSTTTAISSETDDDSDLEVSSPDCSDAGFSLEQAIAHMTSRSADVLRLRDRGRIREGWKADLVLFDPAEISDRATFRHPKRKAKGIRTVCVNGKLAMDEGEMVQGRWGRTLRGKWKEEEGKWVVE